MNRIGIVIVTHNSEREIGPCLDSLPAGVETVVVDNASTDGTCREASRRPEVRLIANPWNRGFAAAANQGIGALASDFVLLLNPDVELQGGVESLAAQCARPGVAAATGKLVGRDGRPQAGFMVRRLPAPVTLAFEVMGLNRLWPGNPVNRRYRCLDLDPDVEAPVEQPAGALMMIRRDVWRELGGFDESFHPVWFEDVDFARRAANAGYEIRYVPSVVAKHSGAHSVSRVARSTREACWYGNLLKYAAKHFDRSGLVAVCMALILGSILRAAFAVIRERHLEAVHTYGRIVRLAGSVLVSGRRTKPGFSSASAVY
jgi:GT2 family glycosyltransferase